MTYTILIVEDEYLVRQGLTKLVNVAAYDMEIIGPGWKWKTGLGIDTKAGARYYFNRYQHASAKWDPVGQSGQKPILKVHLVFLTGYDDFDYALSAVKLGVDDYLLKPFSRRDIEEMLGKSSKKLDKEEKRAVTRFIDW